MNEKNEQLVSAIDFEKCGGLVPTIVQDDKGQVLTLAYSSKESLRKTLETNKATFFSRARKQLWTKGETSGNFQDVLQVRYDCDKDALLFTVRQTNVACHTGTYSCFGEKDFSIKELYEVILDRLNNPKPGSYTSKILQDERLIKQKILEEAAEVAMYKDRENLVWEIADIAYFLLVLMAKKGILPSEVLNELARRRK
jgi:phosphoribosyl-ATP pyrophosphohydrolase/phosphoribosyl-AMP cyclohydrolase